MARRFGRSRKSVEVGPQVPSGLTGDWLKALAVLGATALVVVFALGQAPGTPASPSGPPIAMAIGWPLFVVASLAVLFLNSLLVAAGSAADLLRPLHVRYVKEKSERQAARLQNLLDHQVTYSAACKLGSDLCRLALFVLVLGIAPALVQAGGYTLSFPNSIIAAILLMIPIGVINFLFEMVPRSYAAVHPHGTGVRLYWVARVASFIFSVPAKLTSGLANLITARFGGQAGFSIANQAEEEIKSIAQESNEIEVEEQELLHSVFEFGDTVAREVMTPRVDIDALPVSSTPEEIQALIQVTGHSRIPLYEQTDDQIVGIVHAKDLFMTMLSGNGVNIRQIMRPAVFVPENKDLPELLAEMRVERSQLVVVQDEFGGTAGIVTIEDIVEELVGDIVDEYDTEEPEVVPVEDGWMADGKTHIGDLNDEIGSGFSSEEFDTVGGLVFGLFGRQPKQGEAIEAEGYRFTVAETDGRRILKLHVTKIPSLSEPVAASQ